jgi:hypothetical protein
MSEIVDTPNKDFKMVPPKFNSPRRLSRLGKIVENRAASNRDSICFNSEIGVNSVFCFSIETISVLNVAMASS